MRSGITPVIAVVLLLMMTVAAGGGAFAWFSQMQEDAQDTASESLSTQISVRSLQCRDATATVALSNTGDREIPSGAVTGYLYRDGSLVDAVERDLSGAAVLTPGGVTEVHFPFTAYIEPGVAHRVRVSFDGGDHTVERGCTGSSAELVGYWPLDGISGGTVTDLTGGVDGNVLNDTAETTGQVDGALLFDGADDYVDISASHWGEFFDRGRFSIVAWVRPDSMSGDYADGSAGVFVGQRYGTSMAFGYWNTSETFLNMDDTRGASPSSDDGLSTGTWHHVAAVADWDGQEVTFYVDGQQSGTKTWGDSNINSENTLNLGRDARYDMFFDGALDDVRVYDDALSGDRIRAIYNATS